MYCKWKNTKCGKSKTIISTLKNRLIDLDFGNRINGMINMEGIPKFDIKFDIGIKLTTWIGHQLKTRRQMT